MNSRSYIAIPPGATVREQLEDRHMSQKEFAARMGMSEKHISHLVNGDVNLTPDMAIRLEMVLGTPASFWNRLEAIYREKIARVKYENSLEQDKRLIKGKGYKKLADAGWIPYTQQLEERVINLRRFFEVVELSLLDNSLVTRVAYRSLSIAEKDDFLTMAWIQHAKSVSREVAVDRVRNRDMDRCARELKRVKQDAEDDFLKRCATILASYGIVFVYSEGLPGLTLAAATFLDGSKTIVSMVEEKTSGDEFWVTLFHELGHIALNHIGKDQGTDEDDEQAADEWAGRAMR